MEERFPEQALHKLCGYVHRSCISAHLEAHIYSLHRGRRHPEAVSALEVKLGASGSYELIRKRLRTVASRTGTRQVLVDATMEANSIGAGMQGTCAVHTWHTGVWEHCLLLRAYARVVIFTGTKLDRAAVAT